MDISEHICRLMQRHHEVTIPGFGAIKGSYDPARIHPTQHLFQPPHKSLSFDKTKKTDDGLLTQYISYHENVSDDVAVHVLEKFVADVNQRLKSNGAYLMEGIGKFYLDIEKQLQFLPDDTNNFLLSSYGLSDFIAQPVLRTLNNPAVMPSSEKKKRRFIWFRF